MESETRPASLDQRLRQKLRELNEAHQKQVNQQTVIDGEIFRIRSELSALPNRQNRVKHEIADLRALETKLQAEMKVTMEHLEGWKERERIRVAHCDVRRSILEDVCQIEESELVSDGIDVQTAEIRRQISLVEEKRIEIFNQLSGIYAKLNELDQAMTIEMIAEEKAKLEALLVEKLAVQKSIESNRNEANERVQECQRLLDDLHERQILEEYAKNNGLVLEGTSTDELIRVCRTHQEKIAAKNAAVDASNPKFQSRPSVVIPVVRSPYYYHDVKVDGNEKYEGYHHIDSLDESDTHGSLSSATCNCEDCQREAMRHLSVSLGAQYVRRQELQRRENGLTVAGSLNSKRQLQTRQEHGENGWCQHW